MYGTISFPGLGLSFNPSRVAFSIGNKPIYWYGIIIAAGFLLAVYYAMRRADQFGLTQDNIIDMLICAVPLAIIGARAYYCLFSWNLYKDDPIRVLYIWEGGLAIYGGVIGAVIGLFLYTKVKKVKTSALLDIGGLGLLIGQSIGRWGNFMNREAFGAQTDSFLRMGLTDASGATIYVHPTFLYESVWNAIGLLILHFYSKRRKFDGQIFLMYLGWYGLGRMFIEGLRTDSLYVGASNLRVSQLLAGVCFLAVVIFLVYDKIFREHDPKDLYVNQVAQRKAAEAAAAAEDAVSETEEEAEAVEAVEAAGEAAGTEAEAAPEDASDEDTEA
ncbi:MAG: prolipoprotein diacylglyceryl transferase [Oscillospiraceae bacterium]|nr:prolipoprotein diacylglyceryl transferase [Oscillospiraceae bacterium]